MVKVAAWTIAYIHSSDPSELLNGFATGDRYNINILLVIVTITIIIALISNRNNTRHNK